MKILLVFCHPDPNSYGAALAQLARKSLEESGHTVRFIDLYAEGFNPVFSLEEKRNYLPNTAYNLSLVQSHVDALLWAEGLVVCYPTWYYGPPAMLKGWLERVWLPDVTFTVPRKKGDRAEGKLKNIKLFVGITTSGSPWWWLRIIRDPGRNMFMRGFRPLYSLSCKMKWLQLHNMNNTTATDRSKFSAKVQQTMKSIEI
jgi:NAD(P)H dehydrogenase (quinone)